MPSEKELLQRIQSHADELALAVAEVDAWATRHDEEIETERRRRLDSIQLGRDQALTNIRTEYETQLKQLRADFTAIEMQTDMASAPWDDPLWKKIDPAKLDPKDYPFKQTPEVIRFGTLKLTGEYAEIETPALLPFTSGKNLVIKAKGAGKQRAEEAVRALVLRLLALVPPSKLRLHLFDPAEMGANLAAFKPLGDYNSQLIDGKIWAEKDHINERLKKLSEHMADVIQSWGGQYANIEEYNKDAGDVGEPYRLVVALNFPKNFTDEGAERLTQVAKSGPGCGVYTIVTVDEDQKLPYGFNLADIERTANVITWDGDSFEWQDPDFKRAYLELDRAPSSDIFKNIVNAVGQFAKSASGVAIPFAQLAPEPEQWWRKENSSARGLTAPIGRSGAKKMRHFKLGDPSDDIAPHALIAGRPGSGKSTLLHVLINGLAVQYSPQEVEFYLLDFKQGVEFKSYATHQLPHARVIAIGCEREFGLSVLRGVNQNMMERGDKFRSAGKVDVGSYREATGQQMPRVVLLIDEFQVLFSEEDSIAREAEKIITNIAKQGRSSGIHMVLSSQTLRGTETLPRPTMDQMALRIAMMCSEDDSRVILAEDNPAARLLSRPGEAIYNARGGIKEGNDRFQTALLADAERDLILAELRRRAEGMNLPKPIVFEGSAAADLEGNADHPLHALVRQPPGRGRLPAMPRAWIGDPVSIKSPTAATFVRRGGRNLLIMGKNEAEAKGMASAAVLSLAAHYHPKDVTFYVADLVTGEEGSFAAPLKAVLPHDVHDLTSRQLGDVLSRLAELVDERRQEENATGAAVFLVLSGLQRARDLRKAESYGSPEPDTPAGQLAKILADGPEVGVHVIAWSDSYATLEKIVERRTLREFEMRACMPLPDQDSTELLNSTAAAKLQAHRAIFWDEDNVSEMEKFRPYKVASREWLAGIGRRM